MPRPILYYSNLFGQGTLSGSNASTTNPVLRVSDGSVGLDYTPTSGATPSGLVQVTLSVAASPDALVMPSGNALSGTRFILESEDVGGGNNATVLDFTLAADAGAFVQDLGVPTARRVWRLTVSGLAAQAQMTAREFMLAEKLTLPRSPSVGVGRVRVRQFGRMPIVGGEPFVIRNGPPLRRTQYDVVAISGAEVSGLEAFVDAVDGGEFFYLIDDRSESYFAELLNGEVPFSDEAGVFQLNWTFQEIRAD